MTAPAYPDDKARVAILLSLLAGAAIFGAALALVMNSQGA